MTSKIELSMQYAIEHYLRIWPAGLSHDGILALLVAEDASVKPLTLYKDVPPLIVENRIRTLAERFILFASVTESNEIFKLRDHITDIESAVSQCTIQSVSYEWNTVEINDTKWENVITAVRGKS